MPLRHHLSLPLGRGSRLILVLLLLALLSACGDSVLPPTAPTETPVSSSPQPTTATETSIPSSPQPTAAADGAESRRSAKEAFSIAAPYAVAGDASAQLASIRLEERHPLENDGRGSEWSLLFVSSEGETVRLYVIGGQLFLDADAAIPAASREASEVWSPDADRWDPVGEWVDSTEAIKDALAHSTQHNVYDMALGSISWVFRFYDTCNAPATRVAVSAATGKFIAQHSGDWYRCP